jgi:hypothetical protein
MKDDAIAQLSDQVVALTARMQEIERKETISLIMIKAYEQKQKLVEDHYTALKILSDTE